MYYIFSKLKREECSYIQSEEFNVASKWVWWGHIETSKVLEFEYYGRIVVLMNARNSSVDADTVSGTKS